MSGVLFHDGDVDDLAVADVEMVHLEALDDDHAYLALYRAGRERINVQIFATHKRGERLRLRLVLTEGEL